jgi:hypothetical protein
VAIVGGVFSQSEGFTSLNDLWIGLAFHAVMMALGTTLLAKSIGTKRTALAGASPDKA